ncbi:MAG: hypothetical protein C4536_11970 [Actinobacteria bacterium]|jgi:hypothetical protein|nr:MAG: hypothetical protein C4536_11970 [Actinomycetota bacterium]
MVWKVFLSFEEEDRGAVEVFLQHMQDAYPELEFHGFAAREPFDGPKAADMQVAMKGLLEEVTMVLVMIGRTTYADKWVDWEVRTSADMGKSLLGVLLHSELDHIIPRALKDYRVEICDLNVKHIAETIESEAIKHDHFSGDTG